MALAHGYAKARGAPMAAIVHDIVGLQHASMAIFNAFCDRAPVLVLGATGPMDATHRRPWIDWIHTALVQGTQVRDYVKLDDQPASVAALPEAFLRAWRVARTEPMGPVYLCLDAGLQEEALDRPPALPDPRASSPRRRLTPTRARSTKPPGSWSRPASRSSSWSRSAVGPRPRDRSVAWPSCSRRPSSTLPPSHRDVRASPLIIRST